MDFQYLLPLEIVDKNTIYLVSCKLYHKPYIGRTVETFNGRMSGQSKNCYRVLATESVDETRYDYSLGLHL